VARIRTVKPVFFTSEDIVALSFPARLLYIALWCEADREGRLVWRPSTFKLRYFPGDKVNIDMLAQELILRDLVVLYGDGLAHIPTFLTHQHPNPREKASVLPVPDRRVNQDLHASNPDLIEQVGRKGKEGKGKEGKVEEEGSRKNGAHQALPDDSPVLETLLLDDGSQFPVRQALVKELEPLYPAVDLPATIREMKGWLILNPNRRKTRSGIRRFIGTWLQNEQAKHGG
jgi:hypothetical protein